MITRQIRGMERSLHTPDLLCPKNGVRSALEAGVWLPVVEQVPDAVHGVLQDRGGGEHDHADRGIDERDDVEGGDKTGDLADEAEVFECFHGDRCAVSTARLASGRRKPGTLELVRALYGILDTTGKKCSFTLERSNSEPVELSSGAPTALVDEMRREVLFRIRFVPEHERARDLVQI